MARSTRSRVSRLAHLWLTTLETVIRDTPASRATSSRMILLSAPGSEVIGMVMYMKRLRPGGDME
jgi:hypothetical protein